MFAKYFTTTSLVAALAIAPLAVAPTQASAQDARDIIGGLLIGGAIGYGIAQSQGTTTTVIPVTDPRHPQYNPNPPQANPNPPRPQPQAGYNPPRPGIPATEAGRQVQTALNYFGYDAGHVDGQVGPATRNAVERYQAALGHPVNGRDFPEDQARFLIGAYLWATNGGQAQTGLNGTPLLVAYRGVLDGTAGPTYAGTPGQVPGGNTTVIVNPGTTTVVPAPGTGAPITTASASGTGEVPNLFAGASATPVLSSRCDAVALQGQANGGMMTLGNLSNPGFALSEQFCTARASAVNQGHELTEAITGLTYAQITEQCQGFSAAVAGPAELIGTTPPAQVVASAQGFSITTGIPQAELAGTARVCLGVGYGSDDMAMAMGSALILVAAGEVAYGELLAHHLREGFGVTADAHRAHEWYDISIAAIESGAPAVFSPSDAGRIPLIRQAVAMTLGGQPVPVPASTVVPVLPGAAAWAPQNVPAAAPRPVQVPQPAPVAQVNPRPAPIQVQPEPVIAAEPPIAASPAPVEPEIFLAPNSAQLPTFQVQQ